MRDPRLDEAVAAACDGLGRARWIATHMPTGVVTQLGENDPLEPNDSGLLYLLLATVRVVNAHNAAWDDVLTVEDEDRAGAQGGVLRHLSTRLEMTLENATRWMIVRNDPIAARLVTRHISRDAISAAIKATGVANTSLSSISKSGVQTTLSDLDNVLEKLNAARYSEAAAKNLGLDVDGARNAWAILGRQQATEGALQLLPKFTSAAHLPFSSASEIGHMGFLLRDNRPEWRFVVASDVQEGNRAEGVPGHVRAKKCIAKMVRSFYDYSDRLEVIDGPHA